MNKKLCGFLDITYFVITFFIVYTMYEVYDFTFLADHNLTILNNAHRLIYQIHDMVVVIFSLIVSSVLDFSFISKILTSLKFGKRTQSVVLIMLIFAVIVFGIVLDNYRLFI